MHVALKTLHPARTVIFWHFLNFLLSPLTLLSVIACTALPLPLPNDLVLPVATMIHSRADRCITE
jgi:hypothetical protein